MIERGTFLLNVNMLKTRPSYMHMEWPMDNNEEFLFCP